MIALPLALFLCAPPPTAADVYALAWRGELERARKAAAEAMEGRADDEGVLLSAASVEIEADRFDAAEALVARLAAPAPCPEARVLSALVARRRRDATERMTDALAESWRAAGQPDLRAAAVLRRLAAQRPADRMIDPPGELALYGLGRAEAYLLVPAVRTHFVVDVDGRRAPEWKLRRSQEAAVVTRSGAASIAIATCALGDLEEPAARRRVLEDLSRLDPENGAVALAAATEGDGEDAPLGPGALDAAERAVAMPAFSWPLRAAYLELVAIAQRVDPAHPQALARRALAECLPLPRLPVAFARRAARTLDPALRSRAMALVRQVAVRLASAPTLTERSMAEAMEFVAASAAGAASLAAARERRPSALAAAAGRSRSREEVARGAMLDAWPLASLRREWDPEDEAAVLSRLAP